MSETAPRRPIVFISYSHDTEAHKQGVLGLADRLRQDGVDCRLDQYVQAPPEGWQLWMDRQIEEAGFVLMVFTEIYGRRFRARETPGRGLGAQWEGAVIRQDIYEHPGNNVRFIPVTLTESDTTHLHPVLRSVNRYVLDSQEQYMELLRRIFDRHATIAPPIGTPPPLPQRTSPAAPPWETAPPPVAPIPAAPALPPIWNVPHPRNPNFTGRGDLLTALHDALASGQPAAITQAIHGLGGVGKTQLTLEYAHRHAAEYQAVWWVRAEEPATLAADYAALAQTLRLPDADAQEQALAVAAARRWLEQHRGWLLILDNAPDQQAVAGALPRAGTGHVIITSRSQVWGRVAHPLPVPVLPRPDAIRFLLDRTGQTDGAAAGDLADLLGGLPLALEQAAAYIEEAGATLHGYIGLFRTHQRELLARRAGSPDYPDSVAATWELSFAAVQKASSAAADLLNLCAFLASENIWPDLLTQAPDELPESLAGMAADRLVWNDAVAALRRYSLLEGGSEGPWSVHRLVQAVTRDRLTEQERHAWAGIAVRLVDAAFPGESWDVRNWEECTRWLPHALEVVEHPDTVAAQAKTVANLLDSIGGYQWGRAEYGEARRHRERALAIAEEVYGPNHPEVAAIANNLGMVLRDLGDLAGARAHCERALAIDEAVYGPNHPEVATDVNNLGRVLRDLGDLVGARAHYERALAIDEAAFGPNHPNVAADVNNLGRVLRDLGDLAGARAHFERALTIGEVTLGTNHPNVAIGVNNLGRVLQDLGDLAGARALYERALSICRERLGDDHPNTKLVRENLESLGG